ncbi:MAG: class I SAM-dependent methyltransferase [Verrucomicrobia bacterium]|nr:class I SAM-dependent methyltransferase [Verrucomicrobiota bacterium]
MSAALLDLLDHSLTTARVRFALPDGTRDVGRRADAPANAEPDFIIRVTDHYFFGRIAASGSLGFAESYMDGGWTLERGTLEDFLSALLVCRFRDAIHARPSVGLRLALLRLRHTLLGTRTNVRSHYDIGDDLYACFLDETRGYTCGYQLAPEDDGRTLQENKYERICRKLHLARGHTLLDLGCGYGGFLLHAARHYGARGTGITNSVDHAAFAERRARELGVAELVTIRCGDFREIAGTYDRIASIGMFEHITPAERRDFFALYRRLMRPGGFGLFHAIGCVTATNRSDPFIQKYIFPGSRQTPLSTIVAGFERESLAVLDVENMTRHYHPTTRRWLEAYRANRHTLDRTRYDERFQRMWELYLAGCVAATVYSEGALWQIVVTSEYRRPLPLYRVGRT